MRLQLSLFSMNRNHPTILLDSTFTSKSSLHERLNNNGFCCWVQTMKKHEYVTKILHDK
uniref:Uncharacterized protein n=1 Tax=Lepeophtheirus salmonis TaxID=72036 RepID=A0A0K2UGC2_LEPSM